MPTLAHRLEHVAFERTMPADYNDYYGSEHRIAALRYLQKQSEIFSCKASRYYNTPYYDKWASISRAYASAEMSVGYWFTAKADCLAHQARYGY